MFQTNRRKFLAQATAGLLAGGAAGRSFAQDSDPELTAGEMITPEVQGAIDRGLAYLAARQHPDGSFGSGGYSQNVAVCGLAGLAFMAGGSTPNRGRYGLEVERCVDFILAHTQDDGYIVVPGSSSHGPMYGHGFATLFLSECYGMTLRSDIEAKLRDAVKLILSTQNEDGGWRYQPRAADADISVTICQVMALRAARNAGIYVPKDKIDRCTEYVKRSQNADGGFMYMITGGQSAFPRSAAGVVALYMAGIYDGPEIDKGLEYLMTYLPQGGGPSRESHYYYGHYYAVQAMWHAGGDYWGRWYPAIRDELVAKQRSDGCWLDSICNEYGTAMSCIILQLPNNFLPIIQR